MNLMESTSELSPGKPLINRRLDVLTNRDADESDHVSMCSSGFAQLGQR
jgi:hypothetical protein